MRRDFGGYFQPKLYILYMVTLGLKGEVIHTSNYKTRTRCKAMELPSLLSFSPMTLYGLS